MRNSVWPVEGSKFTTQKSRNCSQGSGDVGEHQYALVLGGVEAEELSMRFDLVVRQSRTKWNSTSMADRVDHTTFRPPC